MGLSAGAVEGGLWLYPPALCPIYSLKQIVQSSVLSRNPEMSFR